MQKKAEGCQEISLTNFLKTSLATDDTDLSGSARRGDLQQEQQSTEGNEDNEGSFAEEPKLDLRFLCLLAKAFGVAFCKNLFG